MRCFLGTKIDEDIVTEVSRVRDSFSELDVDIKPVKDENLHLTTKFLGDINQSEISKIDAVKEVLDGFEPFRLVLKGVGVFPSMDYIKVLWVGAGEGRERYEELMGAVDDRLTGAGFDSEKNKPVAHVTIGRIKSGRNKDLIKSTIRKWEDKKFGTMMVDEVTLFESELRSGGPIYKKLKDYEI